MVQRSVAAFQIKLHSFFRQFVRYLLQKFSLYVFPKHSAHDLRFAVYHNELTAFHSVSVADHPVRVLFRKRSHFIVYFRYHTVATVYFYFQGLQLLYCISNDCLYIQ